VGSPVSAARSGKAAIASATIATPPSVRSRSFMISLGVELFRKRRKVYDIFRFYGEAPDPPAPRGRVLHMRMSAGNAARIRRFLPFLAWFPLERRTLSADIVAGITVAMVAVPQSLAYAQLAGVPAWYGLYAALIPCVIAALFGSSGVLSTGP